MECNKRHFLAKKRHKQYFLANRQIEFAMTHFPLFIRIFITLESASAPKTGSRNNFDEESHFPPLWPGFWKHFLPGPAWNIRQTRYVTGSKGTYKQIENLKSVQKMKILFLIFGAFSSICNERTCKICDNILHGGASEQKRVKTLCTMVFKIKHCFLRRTIYWARLLRKMMKYLKNMYTEIVGFYQLLVALFLAWLCSL